MVDRYLVNVVISPRQELNGDHSHCPRCGGKLFRDVNDLACSLRCGWRESCYFGIDVEYIEPYMIDKRENNGQHENSLKNLERSRFRAKIRVENYI